MGHDRRPDHKARHPVLVTLRAAPAVPSLRSLTLFAAIRDSIAQVDPSVLRVLHFSVQQDHVHAIVEAETRDELTSGIQGLAIRIALAIKRATPVRKVWGDRYHARALTTPREVRRAIAYVLLNFRKHLRAPVGVDPRSSGPWFDGWARKITDGRTPSPTSRPRTWLAAVGWRRAGLIDVHEAPASPNRRPKRN
jgi:REP element-mobilizing transposase RayT